jgi:phosphoenolpyruvate---glycerone phosphotransferase subunit DhaM
VLVLVDLGSAVMSVELAIELHAGQQIVISDAPLVEGAYLAAIEAAAGGDLREVTAAALQARDFVKVQRG